MGQNYQKLFSKSSMLYVSFKNIFVYLTGRKSVVLRILGIRRKIAPYRIGRIKKISL
jgi:hypothetical protein